MNAASGASRAPGGGAVPEAEDTAEDTRRAAGGADAPAGRAVVSVAHDADEQARNLVGWRQTYDQLAAGRFVGTLTELPLDTMKLFRETTSHTLRQACEVRGDAYWFGIPAVPDGGARIDAQPIAADGFACRPGNLGFELLTPAAFSIYGVVVRGDVLRRYAEQVEHAGLDDRLPRQPMIHVGAERLARLRALLAASLDGAAGPRAALSGCERHALQAAVLAALFDICAGPDAARQAAPDAIAPARRRRIVAQARDYVLAHRGRAVGVPELCEQLHVSRRTLQNCFQDVLGMAPATYLRAVRLNGARRDLCGRAAGSVQDVAAAWGFWHLSQFANDYRRMFGMRPSEALRDSAG
ncbi:helix-turn-helix domain-containing protein [Burkholderia glumae]|uniref:Helix-turn-helix domain-containing protein n=3 Tax=Burkholderia glumae TaxID=337 RepID=A0AAP9Y006_BURGL|nr:helix-turn-helix domain-containing protein [Burkholderia glumae]ACR27299.1 HTH-type transcriptional regulator eutR [Burkholderia glumae BGR1]AJY67497.1 helix-turn-helix domain protein [Burkholderia glumae LMG 2196 = ATCC 33617]MCM2481730.1 helix-turn-helix domain-containing protein [Burkholderia glumae]MCM2508129.1 helix-turn-helix domain-containing protein [Burkholderia glumae]MCM2536676.1 helix-turn-helix domain-containing protein [Burkholderia glumae]